MKQNKKLEEANKKFKDLIKKSKNKGLIKSHIDAFTDTPVRKEKHQGNQNYFN